ncbi:MAG: ABC transporter substrate-binding protein [Hydrogeniiclostridium mannosilyticum]
MKLKSFAALMMAGVMTLGLCACNSTTPDASDANTDPVSITTTESWDFSTGFYPAMSPATSNGTYGFTYYARNCYDTLVNREGGEFKAGLAESWDISDDGLTYTFHLKEGVKFSDGADLNAEAVKTSLEAAFSNLGDYVASFGKIGILTESIEVVDEHTVAIHLTTPYYGVLNDLAMCNPMGIVSPNAFNEDLTTKEELMTQTMGTGPYMYAGDGDGASYTFVRNPNYWGEKPDVDEFTVEIIADPDAAVLALRNGEVDLLAGTSRLSFAGYTELSSVDGIGTSLDDSISNSRFIGFNTQQAPFNDAAVRQAVAYAIDKETISESVFSGLETPSEQLLDPSLPYCDVETTTYSYDAGKAKELLENAGWVDSDGDGIREKDGTKLSVTLDYITNQGTMDDAALVIAQELGEVGFEVTPRGSDNLTWFTQVSTDFDFSLHTTYGGYYDPFLTMTNMNPETMSDPVLWQVALTMENGTNTIKELDSTADLNRVQEIYTQVLNFAADQAVLVPFTSAHQYAASTEKIDYSALQRPVVH